MSLYILGAPCSSVQLILAELKKEGIEGFPARSADCPKPILAPLVELTEDDFVVHLIRHPSAVIGEMARELRIPLYVAAAVWERDLREAFTARGLRQCAHLHLDNLQDDAWRKLAEVLETAGLPATVETILRAVAKSQRQVDGEIGSEREVLNGVQLELWEAVVAKEIPSSAMSLGGSDALAAFEVSGEAVLARSRREAQAAGRHFVAESNMLKAANQQGAELDRLGRLLDEAEQASESLYGSSRWKMGNALSFRFGERAASYGPLAKVFTKLKQWRTQQDELPGEADFNRSGVLKAGAPLQLGTPSVEVVVCVHNAPEDVARCLASLAENSGALLRRIVIVNDGSNRETCEVLDRFATRSSIPLRRIDRADAGGYTVAANAGLAVSMADYVVMVNSDTVVPPGWVERVLSCGESDPKIGVVGALSNAASWQSIPRRREDGEGSDWLVNTLPKDWNADSFAMCFSLARPPCHPRVDLLNGFFFAIKRAALQSVGNFDEEAFPKGYGEENDFCFRVQDAGFELAVADDLYVWHAKSKSYSHERRATLSDAAGKQLYERYGKRLEEAQERLDSSTGLAEARSAAAGITDISGSPMRCLFLMPFRGAGGGTHSIVQEAEALRERGILVQLGVLREDLGFYKERYPRVSPQLFYPHEGEELMVESARHFDVAVGTAASSIRLLADAVALYPHLVPAYYIQDYEPRFFAEGDPGWREAIDSYELVEEMVCFAKTEWIRKTVKEAHGCHVAKVEPSLDHDVYFPEEANAAQRSDVQVVCAMVRPDSPHRSPDLTLQVLVELASKAGDSLRVIAFGCAEDDGFFENRSTAGVELKGQLSREGVANVLREADLFLDLSSYQAFGRTGLEAMACGCAVILPQEGGVDEYARDGENALLLSTNNCADVVLRVQELLADRAKLLGLRDAGLKTAANYSVEQAADSIEAVLTEKLFTQKAV